MDADSITIQSVIINSGGSTIKSQGFIFSLYNANSKEIFKDSMIYSNSLPAFSGLIKYPYNVGVYKVKAFVINAGGIAYSKEKTIQAPMGKPIVVLDSVFVINTDTFYARAHQLDTLNRKIIKAGFCFSTSTSPDTSKSLVYVNSKDSIMKKLMRYSSSNTVVYVRAFAINASGISYSNEISFTTWKKPSAQSCSGGGGGNIVSSFINSSNFLELRLKDTVNLYTTGFNMNWFCNRSGFTYTNSSKVKIISSACNQWAWPRNMSQNVKFLATGVYTITATTSDGVSGRVCTIDAVVKP
jgi:hypothetical protein